MSETAFNAYEALRIALEMEKDGQGFYKAMAEVVQDEQVRNFLLALSKDEEEHARMFEVMIETEDFNNAWCADDLQLLHNYIEATVERNVFPGKEKVTEIGESLDDLQKAFAYAIDNEKKTAEFYEKLYSTCQYDTGKKAFAELIEAEKKHAKHLEEIWQTLKEDAETP